MKYHLIVLGCQMNISDSERVKTVLERMGYVATESEDEASLLGVIACSVRQKPIDKVYSRIHKWNKLKEKKNLITFVSGCVLPDDRKKFLKLFDFVFPMSELDQFPDMLKEYGMVTPLSLNREKPVLPVNDHIFQLWNVKPLYQSSFEAFVPIQNGCDKFCSFCAVPYTRGREVSRPSSEILDEIEDLMRNSYKSITLLGQNVNSYGLDREDEISFAELLERIGRMGEQFGNTSWVYFTSPHPRDMKREVIEAVSKYRVLAKQIHLPLQSGDDQVLVKMNRKHNLDRYRQIVNDIRELIPQATLFTDIIVGFTGETEGQFQHTMDTFDEFRFNMAYIAMYSPRPGAQSFSWENDISKEVKKDRLSRLTEKLESFSLNYHQTMVGKNYKLLVRSQEQKTGFLSGLTEGKIVVRILNKDSRLIGQFVNVIITEANGFSVTGELVNSGSEIESINTLEPQLHLFKD